jgi:hypothetical protein
MNGSYRCWGRSCVPPLLVVLSLLFGSQLVLNGVAAAATGPCAAGVSFNPITCENSQPGTPETTWSVNPDDTIEGFATDASVNVGGTFRLKIRTDSTAYRVEIYRLGWYQGNGARLIASTLPSAVLPQTQPDCLTDPTTGLVDCGNWADSVSWNVPTSAVSGIYVANLIRTDLAGTHENQVPFIVRNEASHSAMLFQASDTTWQAYNPWGGANLYSGNGPEGRAYKVSFNRPLTINGSENGLFNSEYPMIRWMERNGYDVSYQSGIDTDRFGSLLTNHKVFLSVGHDEYWSGQQRSSVEAARAAGVNLAFFSGNEVFWKTRYEPSVDGSSTNYRTLVCYKETKNGKKVDPDPQWTGTWRDPRLSPPADGGRPENALTGTLFMVNGRRTDSMTVPQSFGRNRLWRNTNIASTPGGATFPAGTLGYEWDEDPDNGFRPAGQVALSSTTVNLTGTADSADGGQFYLLDYGNKYGPGTATHHLTLYRDPTSHALVFGAGTVQWPWGLDPDHTFSGPPADSRMQQATVNLFADMGVQPSTLQAGLVASSPSADTDAPTVALTSTAAPVVGSPYTVTGTASDVGGVVAGVEVSVDNGATWHPAVGLDNWSYTYTPRSSGQWRVQVRASDDSVNTSIPVTTTFTVASRPCPCSIWSDSTTPVTVTNNSPGAYELGVKFRSDGDGSISGVRFYKGPNNTGTHTGSLWTSAGQQLASATFTAESNTGWQTVEFANPVHVTGNTTYVASYHTDTGFFSGDAGFFLPTATDNEPLHALKSGFDGLNGIYKTGASGFPTSSYNGANYYVDVVFDHDANTAPTVPSVTPLPGSSSIPQTVKPTATFSTSIDPASLSFTLKDSAGNDVPGSAAYDNVQKAATFAPNAPLPAGSAYVARVLATDVAGTPMVAPQTWTFTTGKPQAPAGTCPCTIWSDQAVPAVSASADSSALELGVKFRADKDGFVSGVRFYKGVGNVGTHTGTLWSATGARLSTGTFAGESTTGWQTLTFSSPVQISANLNYVVSYHTDTGHYAATTSFFTGQGADYGPLHALASGVNGANGVYKTGASGFPTASFKDTNYWVDLVFSNIGPAPQVLSSAPADGAGTVPLAGALSMTFDRPVVLNGTSVALQGSAGPVAGTASIDGTGTVLTFAPSSALTPDTSYTASVTATATTGVQMPTPFTWSFRTGTVQSPPGACPCSLFSDLTVPSTPSTNDAKAIEVGVRFKADAAGQVTGIRFYKGAGNGGTHSGSLWTSSGQLLATGTFSGESTTGWQTLTFTTPVNVTANSVYVASYHTDLGRYASSAGFYSATGADYGPLHALRSAASSPNGVYRYGASGFPTSSFNGTNYWVDVVYKTN